MTFVSGIPDQGLTIAYFSMEIGLEPAMPTYSGGLGILAGDTLRAAADLGVPMVGVSLLHRKGYFCQHLDGAGNQSECDSEWAPPEFLTQIPVRVMVNLGSREVQVQAWRYTVRGEFGHTVLVYFLDTALPENTPYDQGLTGHLYGGDQHYRLCQEVVLGLGGIAMLRALGYQDVQAYHMNEGHSAFITLALMEEQTWGRGLATADKSDTEAVHRHCVFTTHTSVPAGHDRFPLDLVRGVLGEERSQFLAAAGCCPNGVLDMAGLAASFSHYINGVSMRHEEVSRALFSNHLINAITNGVHAPTWTSSPFQELYDRSFPEWRRDNLYLRYAVSLPLNKIWEAHLKAKQGLLYEVERRTGVKLELGVMTLGFARRATAYKRADLLFHDLERLNKIACEAGPLQIIYSGKAHPHDEAGKSLIRRVFQAAEALKGVVPVVYLEEYDMGLGKRLCSGVDLWLTTPQKPQEASGTSGMKAALNGVPSLSILDGWWIEGHVEGVTGWAIGDGWQSETTVDSDAASLYHKLEQDIVPLFYRHPEAYARVMLGAIALNGSYFNAQRMVTQYMKNAYLRAGSSEPTAE